MENVPVDYWAQSLWRFAHVMASALPAGPLSDSLKQAALAFVYAQCHLIPCETCREHFNTFIVSFPPAFDSGEAVQLWWLRCHNYTNRMLQKPEWTVDQLKRAYPPGGNYPETQTEQAPQVPKTYALVRFQKPELVKRQLPGTLKSSGASRPSRATWNANPTIMKPTMAKSLPKTIPKLSIPTIRPTLPVLTRNGMRNNARLLPAHKVLGLPTGTLSFQTRQWRALTKKKTGSITKKKCSSCSKRRAP